MKRSLLIATLLAFGLAACGDKPAPPPPAAEAPKDAAGAPAGDMMKKDEMKK